jgi:glucosamine--fructose-6-phosphate aminotransferase (isomerizing)
MVGCGTSLHAGMVGDFAFEELAALQVEVQPAAEFRYRNPWWTAAISSSPSPSRVRRADTLAAVREAKDEGALIMGLVNVVGSTIAREAGRGVYLHAGPEISVASTKAFTGQVAVLLLMALKLGRSRRLSRERGLALAAEIARLPELIETVLAPGRRHRQGGGLDGEARACLLPRARADASGGLGGRPEAQGDLLRARRGLPRRRLKHGPIALLTPGMPVVVLANRSPVLDKTLGNAEECKARARTSSPS